MVEKRLITVAICKNKKEQHICEYMIKTFRQMMLNQVMKTTLKLNNMNDWSGSIHE